MIQERIGHVILGVINKEMLYFVVKQVLRFTLVVFGDCFLILFKSSSSVLTTPLPKLYQKTPDLFAGSTWLIVEILRVYFPFAFFASFSGRLSARATTSGSVEIFSISIQLPLLS